MSLVLKFIADVNRYNYLEMHFSIKNKHETVPFVFLKFKTGHIIKLLNRIKSLIEYEKLTGQILKSTISIDRPKNSAADNNNNELGVFSIIQG